MARRHGVVANLHRRRHIARGIHPLLGELVDLQRDHRSGLGGAWIEPREILLDQRLGLLGVEVAHEHAEEIAGPVVGVPVFEGLVEGVAVEIARPADHRPGVAARHPKHCVELLLKAACGRALGSQPPLLVNDVALGIKLTKHAVVEPIAFHPGPQLELVGGNGDEVAGQVVAGEGIHAAATGHGVDLIKLVFDDRGGFGLLLLQGRQLLGKRRRFCGARFGGSKRPLQIRNRLGGTAALLGADQLGQAGSQAAEVGGVVGWIPGIIDLAPAKPLILLGPGQLVDRVAEPLLLSPILCIPLGIAGADRVGALKHHVFEKVADAGDARPLVDTAHTGHPAGADHIGLIAAGHEQKLHPVVEGELLDLNLLGGRRHRSSDRHQARRQQHRRRSSRCSGSVRCIIMSVHHVQRPFKTVKTRTRRPAASEWKAGQSRPSLRPPACGSSIPHSLHTRRTRWRRTRRAPANCPPAASREPRERGHVLPTAARPGSYRF